jgi:hypothetical protein
MRMKIVDFGIAKAVTDVTQTARSIVPRHRPTCLPGSDLAGWHS